VRYDFPLLLFLAALGIGTRKLGWRSWFGLTVLMFAWILFNWQKG